MDINVYKVGEVNNEQIKNHVKEHESFTLTDIKHMSDTVRVVEKIIEDNGLRCRVTTNMRLGIAGLAAAPAAMSSGILGSVAGVGAAAIAVESAALAGVVSAVGIGFHRLATFNPDYELSKDYFGNSLVVTYRK